MFKRFLPLVMLSLLLSVVLAACGNDAPPTIPTYSGATTVTIPDAVRTQFTGSVKDVKDVKLEGYKTSDGLPAVKTYFSDKFKNDGWTDKTGEFTKDGGLKDAEALGLFVLGFEKGSSAAVVMGLPNALAAAFQITGVGPSDSLYLIFTGNK